MKFIMVIGFIAVCMQTPVTGLSKLQLMKARGIERTDREVKDCDVTTSQSKGVITSPNYPHNYDNNVECIYRISPEDSKSYELKLYFCDFILPPQSYYVGYCRDELTTVQGFKSHCGNRTGEYHKYTHIGPFTMLFFSDETITERGFKIAYCSGCSYWSDVRALCKN